MHLKHKIVLMRRDLQENPFLAQSHWARKQVNQVIPVFQQCMGQERVINGIPWTKIPAV